VLRAKRGLADMTDLIHLALFDLEPAMEEEFTAWYEAEHIPLMLAQSGWKRARRYRCSDGSPLLSLYELDDAIANVTRVSEAPFRNTRFASRGLRNYHARTWQQIYSAGHSTERPEWINAVTVDIEAAYAEQFNRWYNEVHVPEILACPGWRAGRRYECIDGEPRYLAMYELDDGSTPFASSEWESAVGWDAHVEHIRGFYGFRTYQLIFDSADS
jgi:hypothetical protein